MTVISEGLRAVRVLGCRKNRMTQNFLVGQGKTADRLEYARFMAAFLDLRAEIGAVADTKNA
jgi:hypothetical protein